MFFNTDIVIKGEHANMMKELQRNTASGNGARFIDIYLTAGSIGIVSKKKSSEAKNDDYESCNIPRTTLNSNAESIEFLFQICALNEYFDADEEKAVNIAFATNSSSDVGKLEKQNLFHEYALGGLEILYNQIVINPNDMEPISAADELLKQISSLDDTPVFSLDDIIF